MEMQGFLHLEDGWRIQEGEDARFYIKRTIKHDILSCQSRIDMVLTPKTSCPTPFPWATQLGHDMVFWQGQDRANNQAKADHIGVTLQLFTIENKEGDPRKKTIKGFTFKNKEWANTIDQHWNNHLAQWEPGTPIVEWWEEWETTLYDATSELQHLAHKKQHQERDSLHTYIHIVSNYVNDNPTSKGATNMLNKAHKRIHDWENQQAMATKRQRVSYSVNVAEHLHPSYLGQTRDPRTKARITPTKA